MRQTYYFLSFVLLLFVFISCSNDVVGKGTDTIGLETKEVFFKSSKDSIELRTRKGDDWWLTEISTKDTIYRTHSLNVQVIEGGGLYVEKTGRKSIFIRIDSNLTGLERRFTTVIQAGNYYNTITIIQKAKRINKKVETAILCLFVYLLFSSRTKFYISSDTIKNQPPLKSAIDFINGLRDLPMKRMVADEGILAGKLIINWTV